MIDSKERKRLRLESGLPDTLSANTYNLIIGGVILYGFIINALIVWFFGPFFASIDPLIFIIGYFVCAFAGVFITRSDSPILSFIGYNLVVIPVGAVVSICLPGYEIDTILSAIIVTGIVVAVMMSLSVTYPKFFSKMGVTLFIALAAGLIVELIAMLLGYGGDIFNWFFVVVFSLYIGYDWYKAQVYPKTLDNAVDSALDIYLDIINLFLRILQILGKKKRR